MSETPPIPPAPQGGNSAAKQKSVLEVAQEPYPLDPGALYLETMKGRRVRVAIGRDSVEGVLVHVIYEPRTYWLVSLDKHQIEYGKTWRMEDLTLVPASAVRSLALLEEVVHQKDVTETTRTI